MKSTTLMWTVPLSSTPGTSIMSCSATPRAFAFQSPPRSPPPEGPICPSRSSSVIAAAVATWPATRERDAAGATCTSEDGANASACASLDGGHEAGACPLARNPIIAFSAQPVGSLVTVECPTSGILSSRTSL